MATKKPVAKAAPKKPAAKKAAVVKQPAAVADAAAAPRRRGHAAGMPRVDENLRKIAVPLRLPRWLSNHLDTLPGTRSQIVERALVKAWKLTPPATL